MQGSGSGRFSSRARTRPGARSFNSSFPKPCNCATAFSFPQVARLDQIPEKERLNPEAVVAAIAQGRSAGILRKNADAIVNRIVPMLKPNDVVVVFSNGGFDGIHEKLLEARLTK